MAKVYISEYARVAMDGKSSVPSAEEPPVATQVLDTAGTHLSAVFNAETRLIRVHTDGIISYRIAAAPTAVTTDPRMAANQTEYFGVPRAAAAAANEGYKIDVVANT